MFMERDFQKMKLIINKIENLKEKKNIKIDLPKDFPECLRIII
jgi:hypothetical protein